MMNGDGQKEKEKANLEIKLAEIKQGGIHIQNEIPTKWLKKRMGYCEYSAEPEIAMVDLFAEISGHGVLIRGSVSARIKTLCGTCLADLVLSIHADVSNYLLPITETRNELECEELTPEDLDREYFNGDTIVLDEILGDAIMLEMPMNPKCEGVCEVFRTSQESRDVPDIDSRLAPLMGIQIKKEN